MNLLLITRTEILSIIVLLFLIVYDRVCAHYRTERTSFIAFATTAFCHAVMGLITEITVNSTTVPKVVNDTAHIFFFLFALIFGFVYYYYAISLVIDKKEKRPWVIPAITLSIVAILVMLFSPIKYLSGNGSSHSAGLGPSLCYAMGFFMIVVADIIVLIHRKKIDTHYVATLLPISMLSIALVIIQILVPEFLFTSATFTILSIGVFFAIENPIGNFNKIALKDSFTDLWNRTCYEIDLQNKSCFSPQSESLIYVIGDINSFKSINDTLGHNVGDLVLKAVADVLGKTLTHADRIYRIGGDEFAICYVDKPIETVELELNAAQAAVKSLNLREGLQLSISFGFAKKTAGEYIVDLVKRADAKMYEEKQLHYQQNGIDRRK